MKIKKFLYPFVFLIISFVYLLVSLVISNLFFDNGDWSALGFFFTTVILLLAVIVPIYCVKYSKLIQGERFNILFAVYNTVVILSPYMLPLIKTKAAHGYIIVFFIWILFWSMLLLNWHPNTCEDQESPLKEKPRRTDLLLQSNKKNIIVICSTCLYIISLAREPLAWQFESIRYILTYTLQLFSAFLFLVFLFSKKATYSLKSLLLPFSVAGELVMGSYSIYLSLNSLDMQLKYIPMYPVIFTFSCLKVLTVAVMFAGTLFDLRHIKLLKYGAAGHALLSAALLVFNLINVGGIAYHQIDSGGTLAINTEFVMNSICEVLYFVGFFIITTNRKTSSEDSAEKC